jgi:hypothetical protein
MAMERNIEVILQQTLNHSAQNSGNICSVTSFQPTFFKKQGASYEITTPCLPVQLYALLIIFEKYSRFYEIRQDGHSVEGNLKAIHFNLVASAIPERRTSNF